MSRRKRLVQVPDSEHPAAPLGGPVEATMIPGAAGPEAGPRVASSLASLLVAAPTLLVPAGPLCKLLLQLNGYAQNAPDREIQGFE